MMVVLFFFSSRRRHTRCGRVWSSDVCSSDLDALLARAGTDEERAYLLKALAAGHSVDELVAFDAQIHGRSDLVGRLSPINPNRPGDAGFSYVDANGDRKS